MNWAPPGNEDAYGQSPNSTPNGSRTRPHIYRAFEKGRYAQICLSVSIAIFPICLISLLSFSQTSLHGIDVSDLDRKAEPCTDFYEFANGTWRANNPIPASMTRWSKRWQAGEIFQRQAARNTRSVCFDKSAPKGSADQIIGDYYGACMDESRVNARGMDPIKPWFAKIDAVRDIAALQQVMAELHDILVTGSLRLRQPAGSS